MLFDLENYYELISGSPEYYELISSTAESYDDYYTRQLEKVSTSSANFLFSMNETMQRNAKDYSAIQPVHSNGSDPKNYEFSLSRNMTNRNIDQNQTQQQTTSKNNVTSNSGSNPGNRPPVPDTASLLKSAGDLISVNRSNTTGKIDLAGDLNAAVAKRRQSIQPDSDWES